MFFPPIVEPPTGQGPFSVRTQTMKKTDMATSAASIVSTVQRKSNLQNQKLLRVTCHICEMDTTTAKPQVPHENCSQIYRNQRTGSTFPSCLDKGRRKEGGRGHDHRKQKGR